MFRDARVAFLIVALAVLGTQSGAAASAPRRVASSAVAGQAAPVAPPARGLIVGRAVDALTGAPVANVLVGLSMRSGPGYGATLPPTAPNTKLVTLMADAEGRFVVRDVPQGSFLLLATAPGYIVANYGQGRPAGLARTIDLGSGARIDVTIPLWPHAVIDGTVTDEAGEPVVGVTVRALRRAANGPGGQPRYQPATETTTDDCGYYRLSQLAPGQFLVCVPQTQATVPASVVDRFVQSAAARGGGAAGGRLLDLMNSVSAVPSPGGGLRVDDLLLQSSGSGRLMTNPPPTATGALLVYPTTFYGASAARLAASLTAKPGADRSGVDIQLLPVKTVRVSGLVTADGRPVSHIPVRLIRTGGEVLQNDAGLEAATAVTGDDGRFVLLGVPPGTYVLKALRTPRLTLPPGLASNPAVVAAFGGPTPPPGTAAATEPPVGAQMDVVVPDADLQGIVVSLRPGARVTGQLVFSGASRTPTSQELQAVGLLLVSEDGGTPGTGIQVFRAAADGTFTATPPAPGRYLVTALRVPAGWHSTGILLHGQPLSGPIDLRGDDVRDVSLTFTDRVAVIAGTVRTAAGAASASGEVALFSVDHDAWVADPLNPRQPQIARASNEGVFTLDGVLPGDYYLAAVDDADVPDIADPDFFEALSKYAMRVTVAAGETRSQDLTVGRVR